MTPPPRSVSLRVPLGIIAVLILVVGGFFLACQIMTWRIQRALSGPRHTFGLVSPPAFLGESLAIEKAREAMRLDGLPDKEWTMQEDRSSKAPDGSPDAFLSRDPANLNRGFIHFIHDPFTDGGQQRFVTVELKGSEITCEVDRGK